MSNVHFDPRNIDLDMSTNVSGKNHWPRLFSAPKNKNFKLSKSHQYRKIVVHECKMVKDNILRSITENGHFHCSDCNQPQPLRYARLAHVIPLKELWMNFERENNTELNNYASEWQAGGSMRYAWIAYHHANAQLEVICKDCESCKTQLQATSLQF
ncbi:MAG: hypothetical protein CK424_07160 [Legionella sp.]|nr:MAG: hypothetical protein CK424_07160 [Legionella sp.]